MNDPEELREREILGWETGIENTSNPEYNNMQSVGTLQKTL
jgi:hypothetical protein